MIFKEIPLKDSLFEQHRDYAEGENVDIAAYAPNIVTTESEEYTGGFAEGGDVQIVKGIENLRGKFYTRIEAIIELDFAPHKTTPSYTNQYGNYDSSHFVVRILNGPIIYEVAETTEHTFSFPVKGSVKSGDILKISFEHIYQKATYSTLYDDQTQTHIEPAMIPLELNVVNKDQDLSSTIQYVPFVATIEKVDGNKIQINQNWDTFKKQLHSEIESEYEAKPENTFTDWTISYKINNKRDLYTYLHLGGDQMHLVTNIKTDNVSFPKIPYSTVFKLYDKLTDEVEVKDKAFIVREILPQKTEVVELVAYDQEDEDVIVLKNPDSAQLTSPITKRTTEYKTYEDLITTDSELKDKIVDKYISGSKKPLDLNTDYGEYKNYINFSSAEKRLKNFKYKVQQLETYTAESASLVGVTNADSNLLDAVNKIRNIKNKFDGYETYLYNVSSSYVSSSMGETFNASWPKTGSGTYADPYKPVSSSHSLFTNWYGSLTTRTGQIYSASLYDRDNADRLINLLPLHVKENEFSGHFLDFLDMIGQQFDEVWSYITALADISNRQNDLTKGFSKELVYNIAKSLGWNVNDGKDLLDLSRVGFGQKLSGTTYSLYTSGSLSSPPEGDISKEITKRLIASMPYLLKSKGTIGSLKGIINCFGIPSSILRVREYGGLDKGQRASFEIARKFTRVLGFSGSQYVETTWENDQNSSRKPDTVEFRFRTATGSNQILVQKDTDWAIRLKDNGSTDEYGTVSFMLSGSGGYKEASSSLLPVFDGEFYSVMLKKSKIDTELFPYPSFETSSLFSPPFSVAPGSADGRIHNGSIQIVSGSGVSRTGTSSLEQTNTGQDGPANFHWSYTYWYTDPLDSSGNAIAGQAASIADVSPGETYTFSAYAKVSADSATEESLGEIMLFELDSNENAPGAWYNERDMNPWQDGNHKSSEYTGLNKTEWIQLTVTKKIKYPNTSKLGVRFNNGVRNSTIYWDDVSIRKLEANTDAIIDPVNYELFVKKYDAGLDRIIYSSKTNLMISSSASQSWNAAWTSSGDLFIGGNSTTPFSAAKFSGSMMEFRLWTEPLNETFFDTHVATPKSYIGNSASSSYYSLVRRYSFDDNTTLSDGDGLRDVSANQTYTQSGSAHGFGGNNYFEAIEDKTKTMIPNHGPNRRMTNKIRIENNFLSGSGAGLKTNARWDASSNDFAPQDSPKVGIFFSPTDAINNDIVESFANLDFNQYLGDPRDNREFEYQGLKDVSRLYFQKYTGNNNFWDYMHLIKYYDQSVFDQLRRLIPARAKPNMGTLIEGNIFERPKSPVQRNAIKLDPLSPEFPELGSLMTGKINISKLEAEGETEDSRSLIQVKTEYPTYTGTITEDFFREPSLYQFTASNNYEDRNLYISGSTTRGGPDYVFAEVIQPNITASRLSTHNQEYKFYYTSSVEFDKSVKILPDRSVNFYSSYSLHPSDLDPEYDKILALNRSFYEGVKNTIGTTIDGDYPIIIRSTAPTVVVPVDAADGHLKVIDKDNP